MLKIWKDESFTSVSQNCHMCFLSDVAFRKPTFMPPASATFPSSLEDSHAVVFALFTWLDSDDGGGCVA